MRRIRLLPGLLAAWLLTLSHGTWAHALDPGLLDMQPLGAKEWRVSWRKPQVQGAPMAIDAVLPAGCDNREGPPPVFDGRAFVSGWVTVCEPGLAGGEVRIRGLENTATDALVRYALAPGRPTQTQRLTAAVPAFTVPLPQGPLATFGNYFRLGVDHILEGVDHLLFVFTLLLLIRKLRPLVFAITAFTLAHSLTLGAASLGWLWVPAPPVEAMIALSIVVLASELVRPPGRNLRLTERFPWSVAFVFGLLHGLGFARALLDIGLPRVDVPVALLAFNLGVEAGQLLFIAGVLVVGALISRLAGVSTTLLAPGSRGLGYTSYAVGSVAAYWTLERVAGFVMA
ncbi:HupE/UreJ family protein [Motiliproteus sp. SC1-56]|uniref:HupE/UreJ family protein n=1 Tax=Motiliproteus sp. SC1-56 TaxID=2799565 RepID=UPI001A8E4F07|nr:HupE/UreJ family protein [Motiliproteus sp. SC1-56]